MINWSESILIQQSITFEKCFRLTTATYASVRVLLKNSGLLDNGPKETSCKDGPESESSNSCDVCTVTEICAVKVR